MCKQRVSKIEQKLRLEDFERQKINVRTDVYTGEIFNGVCHGIDSHKAGGPIGHLGGTGGGEVGQSTTA